MRNCAVVIMHGQAYLITTGLVVGMAGIPGGGTATVAKAPGCRRCGCAYCCCICENNLPGVSGRRVHIERRHKVASRSRRTLHMNAMAGFTHAGGHCAIVGAVVNVQAHVVVAGIGINVSRVKNIACAAVSKIPANGIGIGGAGRCIGEMNLTRVIGRGSGSEAGNQVASGSRRTFHMNAVAGFTHAGGYRAIVGAVVNMEAHVVVAGIGINVSRVKNIACAAVSKIPADGIRIGGAGRCIGEMNLTRVIGRGSGGEAGNQVAGGSRRTFHMNAVAGFTHAGRYRAIVGAVVNVQAHVVVAGVGINVSRIKNIACAAVSKIPANGIGIGGAGRCIGEMNLTRVIGRGSGSEAGNQVASGSRRTFHMNAVAGFTHAGGYRAIVGAVVNMEAHVVVAGIGINVSRVKNIACAAVSKIPADGIRIGGAGRCIGEMNLTRVIGRGSGGEAGNQVAGGSRRTFHMNAVAGFTHAGGYRAIVGAVVNVQAHVVVAGVGINVSRVKDIACAAVSKIPANGIRVGGAGGRIGELNLTRVIGRGSGSEAGGEVTVLRKGTKRAD